MKPVKGKPLYGLNGWYCPLSILAGMVGGPTEK